MRGRGNEPAGGRAQTAQDFAIGIGFFIVAVAFVFAFIPSMLTFTTADPGVKAAKQADRASSSLLRDLGTGEHPNELNGTATAEYFNETRSEAAIRRDLGLPNISEINLTVRSLNGEQVLKVPNSTGTDVRLAGGERYPEGRPAAEVSRLITMTNDAGRCDPACQLIVRVW